MNTREAVYWDGYDNDETVGAVKWIENNPTHLATAETFADKAESIKDLANRMVSWFHAELEELVEREGHWAFNHVSQLYRINWYQVAEYFWEGERK